MIEGVVILVQQRLHADDLSGHLLASGLFTRVAIPMIAMTEETFPLSATTQFVRPIGDILLPQRNNRTP